MSFDEVCVEIVEQPDSNSLRFRNSEGNAGTLTGANSTEDNKKFPAIRVANYDGSGIIIVSCVTPDKPYRPHPNGLVGLNCKNGVFKLNFTTKRTAPAILTLRNLVIQCPRKNDIGKNLQLRQTLNVDPFRTGFKHKDDKSLKLNSVRLAFQLFLLPDPKNPKSIVPRKPIVSQVINDKEKSPEPLIIRDPSDSISYPCGGKRILLFCNKVDEKDTRIRFYEEGLTKTVIWEDWTFSTRVNKLKGIAFRTPAYKNQDIEKPVKVFFCLEKLSDGTRSNSLSFEYVPDPNNMELALKRKKRKINDSMGFFNYLAMREADYREMSKMDCELAPDVVNNEKVASNFLASQRNQRPPSARASNQMKQPHRLETLENQENQRPASSVAQPLQSAVHNQHCKNFPVTQSQRKRTPLVSQPVQSNQQQPSEIPLNIPLQYNQPPHWRQSKQPQSRQHKNYISDIRSRENNLSQSTIFTSNQQTNVQPLGYDNNNTSNQQQSVATTQSVHPSFAINSQINFR